MRRIATLGLAGLLAIGGCPASTITPVVTVLTAGTYTGTLHCTGTRAQDGSNQPIDDQIDSAVLVTAAGDLTIDSSDYVPGQTTQATASEITVTQTVQSLDESADSVSIDTSGTIQGQGMKFDTTHDITIRQVDGAHLELTDTESSVDTAAGISLQQQCTGTLAR